MHPSGHGVGSTGWGHPHNGAGCVNQCCAEKHDPRRPTGLVLFFFFWLFMIVDDDGRGFFTRVHHGEGQRKTGRPPLGSLKKERERKEKRKKKRDKAKEKKEKADRYVRSCKQMHNDGRWPIKSSSTRFNTCPKPKKVTGPFQEQLAYQALGTMAGPYIEVWEVRETLLFRKIRLLQFGISK